MKLSKDELLQKINEKVENEDIKLELLEDITDSFSEENSEDLEELKNKLEETTNKLTEITNKYKERFLKTEEKEEKKEDINNKDELEEKEVIDVKEI